MENRNLNSIKDHAATSEKVIERYLCQRAKAEGMICLKYSNPSMTGFPDRLLVLREGYVVWVELKSRGRRPSALQQLRHKELREMGHEVHVIDSKAEVDNLINELL
ncbi:MAG: hypothetical protein NC230_09355 [Bacteroides sp.]|nr:hypothetical protein [Bacteroides sp.]